MGLIRQADAELCAKDARVLDFVEVTEEASRIIECARTDAERILEEARRERDDLVSSAYDVGHQLGFQKGMSDGLERGRAEGFEQTMTELREGFSLLDASWNEALASYRDLRATMLEEARTDLVVLATEVAERVTKRYVELDAGVAAAQLSEAIELVLDRTKLVIEVHPSDEEACRAVLPKLMAEVQPEDHARLVTNSELRRGSVVIRTPKGFVDASIDTQVRLIVHALLRDRQRLIDEVDNSDIESFAAFNGAEGATQFDFESMRAQADDVLGGAGETTIDQSPADEHESGGDAADTIETPDAAAGDDAAEGGDASDDDAEEDA